MKKIKINKIVLCCMLFACPFLAMADDLDDGNGDVNDVAAAPINDYIPLMALTAVCFGYYLIQKQTMKEV